MENYVFVIGAGASKEFNLPTGEELKSDISNLLNIKFEMMNLISGDYELTRSLQLHSKNQKENFSDYQDCAIKIKESLPLAASIDNYIENNKGHKKIELIGKLAIVKAILDAEKRSSLYKRGNNIYEEINFTNLNKTWLIPFFKLITQNLSKQQLSKRFKLITIVIFNYDRCVEYFLLEAIKKYYEVNDQEAEDLIKNLNIYHPYGIVGSLGDFQNNHFKYHSETTKFGASVNGEKLLGLAKNIKTFTEGIDQSNSDIREIRYKISSTNKLIFLGFSFQKLNMALLRDEEHEIPNKRIECYCSTFGISNNGLTKVNQYIRTLTKQTIKIYPANITCYNFFNEFGMNIEF